MLTLPIKKKWFDMILSGEKKEEYREYNDYYDSRFYHLRVKEIYQISNIQCIQKALDMYYLEMVIGKIVQLLNVK